MTPPLSVHLGLQMSLQSTKSTILFRTPGVNSVKGWFWPWERIFWQWQWSNIILIWYCDVYHGRKFWNMMKMKCLSLKFMSTMELLHFTSPPHPPYARIPFEQHLVPAMASLSLWLFQKSGAGHFPTGGRRVKGKHELGISWICGENSTVYFTQNSDLMCEY